jgi:hypothetical protein
MNRKERKSGKKREGEDQENKVNSPEIIHDQQTPFLPLHHDHT